MEINTDPDYDDLVVLTRWMATHDFTAAQVAYAVEKPLKHREELRRARAGQPPED
jgi:hypothetical protein